MGVPIDILTSNLFLVTKVAGTADFILMIQAQLSGRYAESFRKLIVSGFFKTLTTVIGFLSLDTSGTAIIRHFGTGAPFGAPVE